MYGTCRGEIKARISTGKGDRRVDRILKSQADLEKALAILKSNGTPWNARIYLEGD